MKKLFVPLFTLCIIAYFSFSSSTGVFLALRSPRTKSGHLSTT